MKYLRKVPHLFKTVDHTLYRQNTIRLLCDAGPAEKCPSHKTGERKGMVVGVYEGCNNDPVFTPAAGKVNDRVNGKLGDLVAFHGSLFKRGECRVFHNLLPDMWGVAVAGLGPKTLGYNDIEVLDEAREAVRGAAGLGATELQKQGVGHILVEGFGHPEHAAEGSALAVWTYQENKVRQKWQVIPTLELHDDIDQDAWQRGLFKAEAQNLARRLTDTPANIMTPTGFAQQVVNVLCPCGIKVEVHDKDWIESKKLNAFLTVARGSCEPPVCIEISYCGGPSDQRPICFVGLGGTYDSGGICLKHHIPRYHHHSKRLTRYRGDMSGAATVVAIIRAAAALSLPLNLVGVVPLYENMPSGMAMKPGDVIFAVNGKSICIENTDNDAQLVLADALVYTQLYYKPRMIIDIATMSRSMAKTFGTATSGVFSNNEQLWQLLMKASVITGDRVWRMPLWYDYKQRIVDYYGYDLNNVGKGEGDPCLGAAFLSYFVECMDWLHIDVSNVGFESGDYYTTYYRKHRMTGRPTRTLIQFLYEIACPQEREK